MSSSPVSPHLENNIVFDQDMAFLCGQEARLQALRADGWGGAWRAKRDSEVGGGRSYVMPAAPVRRLPTPPSLSAMARL